MKKPLRRLGVAVIVMIGLLLANIAYTQVIKADDYRADPNNKRTLVAEYSRQRGQITAAGGVVLARSDPVNDQYEYQRVYPGAEVYADLTGYYSMRYGPTGLERNQNEILSGESPELIAGQLSDLITGRDPRGGNVELNVVPAVQQAAYSAMTEKNYVGAVVAIEPSTGKILAMVSPPSYDPNPLASHSDEVQRQAYNALVNADPSPLVNRAIGAVYPPGSTFKLVIAAAALQNGYTPQTPVTGEPTSRRSTCRTPAVRRCPTSAARPAATVVAPTSRSSRRWRSPATPRSPRSRSPWVPGRSGSRPPLLGWTAIRSTSGWTSSGRGSVTCRIRQPWRRPASGSGTWR